MRCLASLRCVNAAASSNDAGGAADPGVSSLVHYGGWKAVLTDLVNGIDLSPEVARAALGSILSSGATDAQLAGFIIALGMKGGSVPELTGLVDAMLDNAVPLTAPPGAIDIVGSGGAPVRQQHALSVSTMAAFVAAGAGAVICKHGSVAATSSSGSFDTLNALGLATELGGPAVERCIDEIGLGFAFAKLFHPAMRFAAPVRSELGVPTTFNFLGPLSNPGRVKRQLLGVSDPVMAPRVAGVLAARGSERSLVVHGADRLDEITLTDLTRIYDVRDGEIADEFQFDPASIGLERVNRAALFGGTPQQNADILLAILAGEETGPRAEIVQLNAGAGLVVADLAADFAEGYEMARQAVVDGRAAAKLEAAVNLTNELAADGG